MEYTFECSTRYLMSKRSERVRYEVEHEKRYSISTRNHVLFCLLYRHADNDVFDHFPKISEDSPKIVRRPHKRFRTIFEHFRRFLKISVDNRKLPKTFEKDPKMFQSYTNKFKEAQSSFQHLDFDGSL